MPFPVFVLTSSATAAATIAASLSLSRWRLLPARRGFWMVTAITAVVASVFFVHLPVLRHYFVADDFFDLADIASRSAWGYVRDLFLLRDATPSWRFLTGLFYLGAYRAFGLNPIPFLLTSVLVHIGTAMLIFLLVCRATDAIWPAFLASAFFGLTAAHATTVSHPTAFAHVLAGFLVMLSIVTLYEGLARRQVRLWGAFSLISFAGAIGANESVAVLAPVLGLVVIWKFSEVNDWWRWPRQWARPALLAAPYVFLGGAAIASFSACRCTATANVYGLGDHAFGNLWIYLGRLLYPIGMEFPGRVGTAHLVAGVLVAALALAALFRGPALARVCVGFLFLAIVPYLPINWLLAPRHVYMAAVPFSILAALLFAEAARYGARLSPALPGALAVLAFGVMGLYGWQTWQQNQEFASASADWRTLATGLQERYPDLPQGSRVIVRGGPLTSGFWQGPVLGSLGQVIWGDVELFTAPEGVLRVCTRPGGELYVVDFDGGRFTPVPVLNTLEPLVQNPATGATGTSPPVVAIDCPTQAPISWLPP